MKIIVKTLSVALCGVGLACDDGGATGGEGGEGGQNSSVSLIAVEAEEAGDDCEHGGTRIRVGVDENGNSTLEASEVTSTQYVCAAPEGGGGGRTLFETEVEAAGDNCEQGGTKISSGVDKNDDGQLDEDEVSQEQYVCNDVDGVVDALFEKIHFGDFDVYTVADLENLNSYEMVFGWLYVYPEIAENVTFPNLKRVAGGIGLYDDCSSNLIVKSVSFPVLVESNSIEVSGGCWSWPPRTWLEELSFPELRKTGEFYVAGGLGPDSSLALPKLTSVASDFELSYTGLTSVSLPVLTSLGDDLWVNDNDSLTSFSAPVLSSVTDEIGINHNDSLTSVSLPLLSHVGYGIWVSENPVLETFTIGNLEAPLEEMEFWNNPELQYCAGYVLAGQMLNVGNGSFSFSGGLPCESAAQRCPAIPNLGASGRAYRYCFDWGETFADARALCQEIAGFDLPTFADQDDLEAFQQALNDLVGGTYWAGYTYDFAATEWGSIDTTTYDFSTAGDPDADAGGLVWDSGIDWDYLDESYPVICRATP